MPELQTLSNNLQAMEAVMRALVSLQARRSPTALSELLDALDRESGRLCRSMSASGDVAGLRQASAVLEGFIEYVVEEATAA